MGSTVCQGPLTVPASRADQVTTQKLPTNAATSTGQLPPYTSSSSPKASNPRTSAELPPYRANPRLKLSLPPPPNAAEVFGGSFHGREKPNDEYVAEEGQWYWYEGKRVYVRGGRRRVPSNEIGDPYLCQDQGVDMEIEDEEYDCGFAMDLGAESPSPSMRSISGSPGLGSRSSSSSFLSSSGSTSASSLSLPASLPDQASVLPESMSRKPGGAGAVYKREVEDPSEADDRLTREWAVAAGVASIPVSPSIGRRSRGTSVSAAYPPATGVKSISRRSSRSSRWDETDRDCGICFEYAVRPARTACCGKVFCQEHLEDWLSGPNASGLCPNCDAECSLEKDIVSLAAPKLSAVKPKPTKSMTSGGRNLGPANASTRRVVPSSSSGLGLGPEQSAVSRSSSSSYEPLTPVSPNTTSFTAAQSTSDSSSTPTPMQPKSKPNFNVPHQALLSPSARSKTVSRCRTPGNLSPRSLFTSQQQYERLLAQEHRPSSPLSTNVPIINPFDSAAIVGGIRKGVEALVATTDVKEEAKPIRVPPTEKTFAFPKEVKGVDADSEKGCTSSAKEPEMWNGLGKETKKSVSRSDAEYAHAARHAASLLGCLVVLYLVVR